MPEQAAVAGPFGAAVEQDKAEGLVEADDLIEEVSIGGMGGAY